MIMNNDLDYYQIKHTKVSKYESARVKGWDDSEGFLTEKQVEFVIQDEKEMLSMNLINNYE